MAREHYDVRGKAVFITGAASGIGAETAKQLAARGARLTLVDIDAEALEGSSADLGGETVWVEADVTDSSALDRAIGTAVERFDGIDVVMANAGIARPATIATADPREFERTIEVNLLGVWRTVRAALPHVIERQGYVLPVASLAAALWTPLMGSYNMAKAGVDAFATTLRQEVRNTGTKVGCAYFGVIETGMVAGVMERPYIAALRERAPAMLANGAPVSAAGSAVVRGIERRSKRVYAPPWVLPLLYARGLLNPLVERMSRHPSIEEAIELAESTARSAASVNGSKR